MRTNKTIPLVLCVALVLGVIIAASASRGKVQTSPPAQASTHVQEEEEATPVQEGVLTEKQKKHGKLYKGYADIAKGKKLHDLVAEQGDVNLTRLIGDVASPASFSLEEYLRALACKADAIIVGTVKSKSSQIIGDGTFAFTDYEITATDIIKNNAAGPVQPNADITITRIGGTIILNGHKVRTVDQRRNMLERGGKYLLFLEYIPATGAYKAFSDTRSEDSFQIRGNTITQVSPKLLPFGPQVATGLDSFIAKIHSVLTTPCR